MPFFFAVGRPKKPGPTGKRQGSHLAHFISQGKREFPLKGYEKACSFSYLTCRCLAGKASLGYPKPGLEDGQTGWKKLDWPKNGPAHELVLV
jgi:hypothetical protein